MAARARFLHDRGYHTLCIDFQAHGESPGAHITMGHLESMDAAAGVAYLREHYPALPVAVIGTSLGGASALMADYREPPDALVVESVFADAVTATANRLDMRFGPIGRWMACRRSMQPCASLLSVSHPAIMLPDRLGNFTVSPPRNAGGAPMIRGMGSVSR